MFRHNTLLLCLLTALLCHNNRALAQDVGGDSVAADRQTPAVAMGTDTLTDDAAIDIILPDSAWSGKKAKKAKRDWSTWRPNPKRALWLAIVAPGAGQIYNRKFWKLPIVYGGFVGSIYAMQWNNMMYRDYSQAYLDLMDDDPNTQSYNQFMHLGAQITPSTAPRYEQLFKRRKDYYRRYRDLSFFVLVSVYALSVIDAYVDASLSEFDISKDLSMKVSPAVLNNGQSRNPVKSTALGLQCSLNF